MKIIFIIITSILTISYGSEKWPNHDISTLKLLQIVHRHGDRTPIDFSPNDPYSNSSYWKEGFGELTTKGKYRMYKLGQFIRKEYNSYLGEEYSPREVYARSSITERCLESVSVLLSGVYPPKNKYWQWNNESDTDLGRIWQPIPIETEPKVPDLVLNEEKFCPIALKEQEKIRNSDRVKQFLEKSKELYQNLSKIVGYEVNLSKARSIHGTLQIEIDNNYYWDKVWTKEEERKIIDQLYYSHQMSYRTSWDSPIIKRMRAGGLVKELNKNLEKVINNTNTKKLYVYSTHDTVLAALMHALDIFNDDPPPFGSALFLELHQNKTDVKNDNYFVKIFYHNNTLNGIPHSVPITDCDRSIECPVQQYFQSYKHLIYNDFDKECNKL